MTVPKFPPPSAVDFQACFLFMVFIISEKERASYIPDGALSVSSQSSVKFAKPFCVASSQGGALKWCCAADALERMQHHQRAQPHAEVRVIERIGSFEPFVSTNRLLNNSANTFKLPITSNKRGLGIKKKKREGKRKKENKNVTIWVMISLDDYFNSLDDY